MKALLVDNVNTAAVEVLKAAGIETVVHSSLNEAELCDIIGDFDAILLRNLTFITPKVIKNAQKLKVIGRVGAGLDNIDMDAAEKAGIRVIYSPDGNTVAAAEHTMAMMLALSRQIPAANASVFAGKWDRERFIGSLLCGKTLGIIGFGRIGAYVARLAEAFGMNIVVYSKDYSGKYRYCATLEEFLPLCDYITMHVPKTPETVGMINLETISLMKKGVKIINCARGGLAVESDLVQGLEKGIVSGIATDVFENEPDIAGCPLLKYPDKVVAVPHLGANTIESQIGVARDIASQVRDILKN